MPVYAVPLQETPHPPVPTRPVNNVEKAQEYIASFQTIGPDFEVDDWHPLVNADGSPIQPPYRTRMGERVCEWCNKVESRCACRNYMND